MVVERDSESTTLGLKPPRRGRRRVPGLWALALAGAFWVPGVRAQEGEEPPALGLGGEQTAGIRRASPEREAREERAGSGRRRGVLVPYHVAPWYWYGPQTYRGVLPPLTEDEPRLGIRYYDGYRMGIRVPADAEPPYTYSLGPYRGVVRSPQRPEWLYGAREGGEYDDEYDDEYDEVSQAVALLRDGQYRAAGGRLADGFRATDDPRYPLLLAEVLFALGEYKHAELLLRHALDQEGVFAVIPEDVVSHFPSREVYREKLGKLRSSEELQLLKAYFLLFSENATEGLDGLVALMAEDPADETPRRLYRHFLGKAFGAQGETKASSPGASEETKS